MQKYNKRDIGAQQELLAARYVTERGAKILEKNFRSRQGEIDLIYREGGYLVFAEVKYRRNAQMGSPQAAVGIAKQKKICRVADYYRYSHGLGEDTAVRYDVIAIQGDRIEWIKNAFMHCF